MKSSQKPDCKISASISKVFICAGKRLGVNLFEVTTHGSFTLKFRVENRLSASCSDWQMTQKVQSDKNFVSRNLSGTLTFPYRPLIVHSARKPSINFHVDVPFQTEENYFGFSSVIKLFCWFPFRVQKKLFSPSFSKNCLGNVLQTCFPFLFSPSILFQCQPIVRWK